MKSESRLIIDVFDECRKLYFAKSKTNKIKKQIGCKAFMLCSRNFMRFFLFCIFRRVDILR